MQEAGNVLKILEATLKAVKEEDAVKLKKLSDQTIHSASVGQEVDNVTVAVVVYSLSKIIERGAFKNYPGFKKKFLILLKGAIDSLEKKNRKEFGKNLKEIRSLIEVFSGKLKEYIKDVFRKASINKASKIYEHGISQERTASLLGITMFELASYAGQRDLESVGKTISIKQRIKIAERIFR